MMTYVTEPETETDFAREAELELVVVTAAIAPKLVLESEADDEAEDSEEYSEEEDLEEYSVVVFEWCSLLVVDL